MEADFSTCLDARTLIPSATVMRVGYYRFWSRIERRDVYVHRHVYEECFGAIPEGMVVMHKCDNRLCVNPEHLQLGTDSDNSKDMWRKGRGKRLAIRRGEDHHNAKLRETDIRRIRSELATGRTQREIAAEFGVDQTLVSDIKTRKIWGHVR